MLNILFTWISHTKLWVWLSKKIISKLTFRIWGHTTFPMEEYLVIENIMRESRKTGSYMYAFALTDTKSFAAMLIRFVTTCFYTHAGIIVGDYCYHMKAGGIKKEHILEVLKQTDYFVISRFKVESTNAVENQLKDLYDKKVKYDFQQELGNDYIYCSELVYIVGKDKNPNIKAVDVHGRLSYEPDTILEQGEIIYEHGRI
jgi:hypothetical protein